MGTGSGTGTTGGPNWQAGTPSPNTGAFYSGNRINASDINSICNAINQFASHYHSWTDIEQEATFGSNGDRNTYSVANNTNGPAQSISIGTASSGQQISAAGVNAAISVLNTIAGHTHYENDNTTR